VGTDEPVEQLKLVQVTDQQVVGDGIYLVGVLSSPAVARDDALVGEIECTEVVERTRTPDRVVVRTAIPLATGGGLRVSLLGGSLSASTGLSNRPGAGPAGPHWRQAPSYNPAPARSATSS